MSASLLSDNAHNGRRFFVSPRFPLAAALLAAVAASTGCAEKWAEVFPVTGSVKVDGQPAGGALVALNAVNPAPDAVTPTASVKPDGTFVVSTYQSGDGAAPGEYVVTVIWNKFDEKLQGAGPNVIPEQYGSPKTSPFKVTVNAGAPTQLEPINITAKTARAGAPARR